MVLIIYSKSRATPITTPTCICVEMAMGVTKNPAPLFKPLDPALHYPTSSVKKKPIFLASQSTRAQCQMWDTVEVTD